MERSQRQNKRQDFSFADARQKAKRRAYVTSQNRLLAGSHSDVVTDVRVRLPQVIVENYNAFGMLLHDT